MNNEFPIFQNPQSEGGSFFWPGDANHQTAVLLFHGFTATTVEVRQMAKYLNEQGFSVSGKLLPGHGVSPDELNKTNYGDWISCAEDAYHELAGQYKQVFVLGESMGGLLSLWLGATHPEIKGLLLFAPALRIKRLWQSNLVWPFVTRMNKKNVDLTTQWQGFNVVPMRAAAQLYQFQNKVNRLLEKVTIPTIIFQGKLDTTIDPISSLKVLEKISSDEKELVWLEESSHCILMDKQMALVSRLSLDFIKKLD